MLLPHSGRIAKAQRIAGTKSQENEFLKNSQTGLCRTAQARPEACRARESLVPFDKLPTLIVKTGSLTEQNLRKQKLPQYQFLNSSRLSQFSIASSTFGFTRIDLFWNRDVDGETTDPLFPNFPSLFLWCGQPSR